MTGGAGFGATLSAIVRIVIRELPESNFDSADSIIKTAHVRPDLRMMGLRIGAQIVDPDVRPR